MYVSRVTTKEILKNLVQANMYTIAQVGFPFHIEMILRFYHYDKTNMGVF